MRKLNKHQQLLIGASIAMTFALAGFGYAVTRHVKQTAVTVTPATFPSQNNSTGKDTTVHAGPGTEASPTGTPALQITNPDHPATSTLAKPLGQILNNSAIRQSDESTAMESTCRSVAGAVCYVRAQMAGTTIILSDSKTIPEGSSDGVIFDWDAKKLSVGTWQVQLVASKNGQTSLSDSATLEVKP